jgi:hypothetical protein
MIGPHAQSYGMLSGNILLDQCIAGFDRFGWVKQLVKREQISMLPPSLELLRNVERKLATIGL